MRSQGEETGRAGDRPGLAGDSRRPSHRPLREGHRGAARGQAAPERDGSGRGRGERRDRLRPCPSLRDKGRGSRMGRRGKARLGGAEGSEGGAWEGIPVSEGTGGMDGRGWIRAWAVLENGRRARKL